MKQYQELLWLGVPKNDRKDVRGSESTRYVDPAHIYMAEVTCPPKDFESYQLMTYKMFSGDSDIYNVKLPDLSKYDYCHACFTVRYLKILDNIPSEEVWIGLYESMPITLEWKTENDNWKVMLAPRIENK